MPFNDIIGQEHALGRVKTFIGTDRIPHAMGFVGPRGTGKRMAALALAKALHCSEVSRDFCDSCTQCNRINHGNHPEVWLFELPATEANYRIDGLREEFLRPVYIASAEGGPKVFIIDSAHRIAPAGQNAILKTLEEPPAGTYIILLAEELSALLGTVRSRLQVVNFAPLGLEALASIVGRLRPDAGVQEMDLAARFARGSVERALELLEAGGAFLDAKRAVVSAMAGVKPGAALQAADRMIGAVGAAEMATNVSERHVRRGKASGVLEIMLLALRDAALIASGGDPAGVVNADQLGEIRSLAGRLGAEGACRFAGKVEQCRHELAVNVYVDMMFKRLALELASMRRSAGTVKGGV
jgi:DNA polymerase-3 subunit delta'